MLEVSDDDCFDIKDSGDSPAHIDLSSCGDRNRRTDDSSSRYPCCLQFHDAPVGPARWRFASKQITAVVTATFRLSLEPSIGTFTPGIADSSASPARRVRHRSPSPSASLPTMIAQAPAKSNCHNDKEDSTRAATGWILEFAKNAAISVSFALAQGTEEDASLTVADRVWIQRVSGFA